MWADLWHLTPKTLTVTCMKTANLDGSKMALLQRQKMADDIRKEWWTLPGRRFLRTILLSLQMVLAGVGRCPFRDRNAERIAWKGQGMKPSDGLCARSGKAVDVFRIQLSKVEGDLSCFL